MRRGEHLYAVRSDAPRVWFWTYHFSDKSLEPSVPSISSLDLLNMILDSDNNSLKQQLAAPPAWSNLTMNLEFSPPISADKRPILKTAMFTCNLESLPTSDAQRVLDVRAEGASEGFAIKPTDLAGRGNGFGDAYRIYNKADKVTLDAPLQIGQRVFSHWDVLASETHRTEPCSSIEVVLDTDTLAYCRYQQLVDSGATLRKSFAANNAASLEGELGEVIQTALVVALKDDAAHAADETSQAADDGLPIHASASASQPVIGLVAGGEQPTVLEENVGEGGWKKVAYKGLVGYVSS